MSVVLLAWTATVNASAQPHGGAHKKPPPPPPPPPAAAAAPTGSEGDLARARALDKEGAKAYGEGRYNDAIRYFEEAHRLGGPAFELWNVAKCYLRLDQPEQAAEMLERYLATPNLPKDDREEASAQLDQLKKRPSPLTVSSTPSGAQVSLDGKALEGRTPLSVTIPPGSHTVTVSSATSAPYTRTVEARYGRAVIVDASLASTGNGGSGEERPPPPENPYATDVSGKLVLRGALGVSFPRQGTVGGSAGANFMLEGLYRFAEAGIVGISGGALLGITGDSWDNRTGEPNTVATCVPPNLNDAQSATALSFFGVAAATVPITQKLHASALGGLGLAGYFAGDAVGGDLFVASCRPSPGVRPAILLGAQLDYAVNQTFHVSFFPITWQVQPAFDGTRAAPRDASGVWMRFGISIGAGVDLL